MSATTKTFHYVCSHDLRAENPLHIRLTQMFDAVRRETGGRLEVEIVPWGGTGPSKVTLTKLLEGEIAFHPVSGMPLSTIVPLAALGLRRAAQRERLLSALAEGIRGASLDAARREARARFALTARRTPSTTTLDSGSRPKSGRARSRGSNA